MAQKELLYYNTDTQRYESPYATQSDVSQLAQTVSNISDSVSDLEDAVTTRLDESRAYTNVVLNQNQSVASGYEDTLDFTNALIQNNHGADFVTKDGVNLRLKKGIYDIILNVVFDVNPSGFRQVYLQASRFATSVNASNNAASTTNCLLPLLVEADIDISLLFKVLQDSGVPLDVLNYSFLTIRKVADLP